MRMSHASFHPADERLQQEAGEPHGRLALHYLHYNFCRVHQTLRVTPAMEAGIADHVWTVEEIVAVLDAETAKRAA